MRLFDIDPKEMTWWANIEMDLAGQRDGPLKTKKRIALQRAYSKRAEYSGIPVCSLLYNVFNLTSATDDIDDEVFSRALFKLGIPLYNDDRSTRVFIEQKDIKKATTIAHLAKNIGLPKTVLLLSTKRAKTIKKFKPLVVESLVERK